MNRISNFDDSHVPISHFKEEIRKFVKNRNWEIHHTPKNLIQAISIEVSELSQCLLFKDDKIENILKDNLLLSNLSDEIADVFIYLLSLINILNIDLTSSFIKKMEKNRVKYPIKEFNDGKYYKK